MSRAPNLHSDLALDPPVCPRHSVSFLYWGVQTWTLPDVAHKGLIEGNKKNNHFPYLLATLLQTSLSMILVFIAAKADCWLIFGLLTARSPDRLLHNCFFPSQTPACTAAWGYSIPDAGLCICFFFNDMRFLSAHFSSLSRSVWAAALASFVLAAAHAVVLPRELQGVYSIPAAAEQYQPPGNTIWNWLLVGLHIAKPSVPVKYSYTSL